MIKLLLFNIQIRWREWTDKRPLIGEELFINLEKLHENVQECNE